MSSPRVSSSKAHGRTGGDGKPDELHAEYLLGLIRVLALGLLGFLALLSLGVGGTVLVQEHVFRAAKARTFERAVTRPGARTPSAAAVEPGVLGRIVIPRLGFSAAVRDGTSPEVLKVGVGHIPGSALPGEPGNVGLTGRRETFFRSLDGVQTGDLIRLTTPDRTDVYRVESVRIVAASRPDRLALEPAGPALTLVTRYSFVPVGRSARQLVVISRLVS